jgi:BMFP domain-containing protein YqiC
MQARISELARQTPARDLEQNVRALLQQGFARLDLATREELDLQNELLARARARLTELEARVAELEKRASPPS